MDVLQSSVLHHSPTKENLSPSLAGSSPSAPTPSKFRPPLQSNSVIGNQPESCTGKFSVVGMISTTSSSGTSLAIQEPWFDDIAGVVNIVSEIESIEKEISRLSTRLEYLRLEKLKRIAAKSGAASKRGRFVPAKFMDPPVLNPRKMEESMSAIKKTPLGRRGISLGPAEIYSTTNLKKSVNRQEITPVNRSQSRRKSCFWKLQEVDELKVIHERGENMSLSLKSQKTASKLQVDSSNQAATTLRTSKNKSITVKKEEDFSSSIQPKELFKDGDKSVAAAKNKSLRCSRVVASRYMSSIVGNTNGDSVAPKSSSKRPLPGNDMECRTFDRKRISLSRE